MTDIETVAYQARAATERRPCGPHPCRVVFPALPSRWCINCLLSAVLEDLAATRDSLKDCAHEVHILKDTRDALVERVREDATAAAHEAMRRRWDEVFGVSQGAGPRP